ncbi:MAG: tetratricopeptide repeat protein [Candidatus Omnitrophica bacterium]|nr:tetratricopeptide repeat protein [Candidatus Omnitrophota bacterium]
MPTRFFSKFKSLIFIILIIILGFSAYFNCLGGDFIWDDLNLIKNNTYIRNWSGLPQLFTKNIYAGSGGDSNFYRPLQMATYSADYSFWKLDVRGYHLTNILLHVLAALALYFFICVLFNQQLLALFSALLFAVHPVHTEAVAYLSGRADPLSAIFIILSFIFYLKFLQDKKNTSWVVMLLSFIFALLSRENALILPLLLLLYHYTFKSKPALKSFLPFLIISASYILLRLSFMTTLLYALPPPAAFIQRLSGFFAALSVYYRILFLPLDLHMEYGNLVFSFFAPQVILGFAIILFLLACILKSKNTQPLIFFSLFWFILTLVPVSNLYPLNAYMAEHWLYLPSIGFFIILGNLFVWLYKKSKILSLGLFICLLFGYFSLTIKQNDYWKSAEYFFKRTLQYAPWSYRVYYNLGNFYSDAGDTGQGIRMYQKAIQINPQYAEAFNNIGGACLSLGKNAEAVKYFQEAVRLNPGLPQAYYNLGNAYHNLEQKDKSIKMFEKSIKLNPAYPEAYNNLAAEYADSGNIDEAIRLWNKTVQINPDFTAAHFNLCVFYFMRKEYALAIRHCDRLLALGGQVDARFLTELGKFRNKKN